MQKLSCLLFCSFIFGNVFSQTATDTSLAKTLSDNVYNEKDASANIIKPDISIYPNPAKNKVTVQVKQFDPGMVAVKLMDIKGKIIRQDNRLLTEGTEDIVMFLMLRAGIYFIQVSGNGKVARKKLVIL